MEPFVTGEWLAEHLDDVVVVDVRWAGSDADRLDAYASGHVPGAVSLGLDEDLSAPPSAAGGRHPLPDPDTFAATLTRSGIGDTTAVVAYDDRGGVIAARLVWMLRTAGRDAALLDGGLAAWPGEPGTGPPPTVRPAEPPATAVPWPPSRLADADATASASVVVDARDAARFAGVSAGPDARAGRVPGAVNRPALDNTDGDGLLLPDDVLRDRFAVVAGDDTVVHCGSGVTACHDLLVMERLGLPPARLFVGSWSAWAADPTRPVEVG